MPALGLNRRPLQVCLEPSVETRTVDGLWPFFDRDKFPIELPGLTRPMIAVGLPFQFRELLSGECFDTLDESVDGRGVSHGVDTVVGCLR